MGGEVTATDEVRINMNGDANGTVNKNGSADKHHDNLAFTAGPDDNAAAYSHRL